LSTTDFLFFYDNSTYGDVMSDVVQELFHEPLRQQLIGKFEFDETLSPSPLMNVIRDMSGFGLFERTQNLGSRFVVDW
jgi:hypothetical protein